MDKASLLNRIKELELENSNLKEQLNPFIAQGNTVKVPENFKPIFDKAEDLVSKYFLNFETIPEEGRIEINNERYVLLRASSLSVDFFNKIKALYADKGEAAATIIGKNFLFDIAHVIGLEDAKSFQNIMNVSEPIEKLSAGPIHFAYTGWAFVDILPESNPEPNENYFLKYHHPYSFEADSWIKSGIKSDFPVCIMNAGYSSGWCEHSYGMDLTAVEISCRAMGDENCTFIMAPPDKIDEYIKKDLDLNNEDVYDVPLFFERKKAEEAIRKSLEEKDLLIKEIHHRVKNNLQIISSLLNLQSNYLNDIDSKKLFKESQNRIKTLALVHEKLHKSEDLEFVNLIDYVKSIITLLSYSYNMEHINLEYEIIDDNFEKFNIEKAIPFGLIINEIVSNSFKYAFPDNQNGKIKCSIYLKSEKVNLKISDDGVGFKKNFDLYNSDSLGLELIFSLVDQLDGKIDIRSVKGVEYHLVF